MEDNRGLSYFFLGLGIGVAVGVMFAPQSGEETRGVLRSKAQEGGDYLRRRGEEFRDQASDVLDRGRTAVQKQREQLGAAVEAGKQAYRETMAQPPGQMPGPVSGPESV